MSTGSLAIWEKAAQKSNLWLKELAEELGWKDLHHTYIAVRSVLHALRDRLTPQEAADLASQLPLLIKGIYYDGWSPGSTPVKARSKEDFLGIVWESLRRGVPDADPERVTRAVFDLLARHVSEGEIRDIRRILPEPLRELWPETSAA